MYYVCRVYLFVYSCRSSRRSFYPVACVSNFVKYTQQTRKHGSKLNSRVLVDICSACRENTIALSVYVISRWCTHIARILALSRLLFSLQNGLIAFNAPCTIQHCSDLFSYIHRLYGTCAHSRYEEIALHFFFLDTGFVVSFRPSHQANAGIETSNAELSQATICKAALGQLKKHNATEYRRYIYVHIYTFSVNICILYLWRKWRRKKNQTREQTLHASLHPMPNEIREKLLHSLYIISIMAFPVIFIETDALGMTNINNR